MASQKKSKSLLGAAFSLSFFTLLSRILGLLREMTKAKFLGTSSYADAFVIAFMIPNLFRRLFAENAISVAFIPTFRGYLEDSTDEGVKKTREFAKATLTLVSFLTAVVVTLGIIFTPLIIKIFYKENDLALISETAILTRIMFPYLFVISIAAFFQGILNGVKIFSPSGFTPVLFNSIVIAATYVLSPYTENPARAMSIGVIIGGCVQAIFQLPFVIKAKWWCGFTTLKNAFTNPGTRKVLMLIGPTIIGMACYQLNDVVSTALAGRAGKGIVSSLQYSLRLQELILGIFAVSIGTVILPDLSGLAKRKEWEEFNTMLAQAIKIIALISIPITFFSLITDKEIISLVYKNRRFDDESVRLTMNVFPWHIAGLFFIAANRIIAPAFYAQGDTKSPTFAGIIGFAFNILLALILVKPLSGAGIAIALSAASLINTLVLFVFLKRNKNLNIRTLAFGTIFYSSKLILFSVVAGIPTYFVRKLLVARFADYGRLVGMGVPLAISAAVFALVGVALLVLTRDEIVKIILKKLRRR
ncbi:murein biosynthesis integral membrane protein MurJ [Treponema zioleckii]|uniref:murein biosynthesis integral membrane protein MurJ n=1 Tax=Treponema zioleckii TaxID=331680 RepID=UPI00168B4C0E|nr:murein biosynthesis integral membrane protein MurJ [Treponema zioleckii]